MPEVGRIARAHPARPLSGRAVRGLAALVLALWAIPLWAHADLSAAPSIKGYYHHAVWIAKDGAPGGIGAITQTRSGWLWVGGDFGVDRFDGETFERLDFRPPGSTATRGVSALYTAHNGDVWLGYERGGTVRIIGGDVHHAQSITASPDRTLAQFIEDGDGRMWAAGRAPGEFWIFENGRWIEPGPEWGLPTGDRFSKFELDADGSLWLGTASRVAVLLRGSQHFEHIAAGGVSELGASKSGRLWKNDHAGYGPLRVNGPDAQSPSRRESQSGSSILAAEGYFWSVACDQGVCRVPCAPAPATSQPNAGDRYTAADGLSADRALILFEDRDDNIWVGTKLGLDQFRRTDFATVQFPEPLADFSLFADAQRGIWTATLLNDTHIKDGLWHVDPSGVTRVTGFDQPTEASVTEADGSVVLGGFARLWRMREGEKPEAIVPVLPGPSLRVASLLRDARGNLWVSLGVQGLFKLEQGQWIQNGALVGLPAIGPVTTLRDQRGTLWLGYRDNRVLSIQDHHVASYTSADGLAIGVVRALLDDERLIVGGDLGVEVFDGQRFFPLRTETPELLSRVSGLARGADEALWVVADRGAMRIEREELHRAIADPHHLVRTRLFDDEDGLPGGGQTTAGVTVVNDPQGRLWVAASDGLAWVDPRRLSNTLPPPPVEIQSIDTTQTHYLAALMPTLPAGTRTVQIQYTAPALSVPARIRFRVRLQGVDPDWVDRYGNHTASYSNLGPGRFRFEVVATNGDGAWTPIPVSAEFTIPPLFYQSHVFYVLCACAATLLLWQLYQLRLRQVAQHVRARSQARVEERERIARDLHDTLIQGVQGMILLFQGYASELPAMDPTRRKMEGVLDQADQLLREARERVSNLRTLRVPSDITAAIRRLGEELFRDTSIPLKFLVSGSPRPLDLSVADNVYQIAREALTNALRHAQATTVEIELLFENAYLGLRVRDDGRGFEPSGGSRVDGPRHFGVQGIRERAQRMGGELKLWSREGAGGTEIDVTVPATRAYPGQHSQRPWWRRLRVN
jgi:signal transduction histidine kinase/ligand-binding sensor domain-containing protein